MFQIQKQYRRRDIHRAFGGQTQGGISTPADQPVIFLFAGESGEQYGYRDGWSSDGTFSYTGEGQFGDMEFKRGNAAIRDHVKNGKDIHIFRSRGKGFVTYLGQFVYGGYEEIPFQPDFKEKSRTAIQFRLVEASSLTAGKNWPPQIAGGTVIIEDAAVYDTTFEPEGARFTAEQETIESHKQVLDRADGVCEGCRLPAPFVDDHGSPYLEVHSLKRLTDLGPVNPKGAVALCPNCHKRAHHSADREEFSRLLASILR